MAHQQYLEQTVQQKLQTALEEIVSRQPDDAVGFLAEFFEREINSKRESLLIAADLLLELRPPLSEQTLNSTVYRVYALLSESEGDCLTTGIVGLEVNRFVRQVFCDLETSVSDALLRKLRVQDGSTVLYSTFKSRVNVCVLLLDYLRTTTQLFNTIDRQGKGSIKRHTGEDILSRLSAALSISLDITQNVEQTKHLLKPAQLEKSSTSSKKVSHIVKDGAQKTVVDYTKEEEGSLSSQEFQQLAARVFISHLPSNTLSY